MENMCGIVKLSSEIFNNYAILYKLLKEYPKSCSRQIDTSAIDNFSK